MNRAWVAGLLVLAGLWACSSTKSEQKPEQTPAQSDADKGDSAEGEPAALAQAVVAAPDRSPEDKALDNGRHPDELLAFAALQPGMQVADLGAGGGYTTELLARAVGSTGRVWGQNNKFMLERFAEGPWSTRLQKPVMANVTRVDRDFDDPLPPEAKDLDLVINVLFYHDTVWLKTDRDAMNKGIFNALRSGGHYVIVDHAAAAGAGDTVAESLHRIEEGLVVEEVTRAGFELESKGAFLANAQDERDWNASPRAAGEKRGTSDRFVLKFRKP